MRVGYWIAAFLVGIVTLSGCGGGGGSAPVATVTNALVDANGRAIAEGGVVASGHRLSIALKGYTPNALVAFAYTGPAGVVMTPRYGIPGCTWFMSVPTDSRGAIPSFAASPVLTPGSWRCDIYEVTTPGLSGPATLKSTVQFSVSDAPSGIPSIRTGTVSGPTFTPTSTISTGSDLYVQASGLPASKTMDLYLVDHQMSRANGAGLFDMSGTYDNSLPDLPEGTRGLRGTSKTVATSGSGAIGPTLVWKSVSAEAADREFDVVIDVDRNGVFTSGTDIIADTATPSVAVSGSNRADNGITIRVASQYGVAKSQFTPDEAVHVIVKSPSVPLTPLSGLVILVPHRDSWQAGTNLTALQTPSRRYGDLVIDGSGTLPQYPALLPDLPVGDYDVFLITRSPLVEPILFDPSVDVLLGGAGGPAFTVGNPSKKKWTVMVYIAGNSDLSTHTESNMKQMEVPDYLGGRNSSDVNVLVQLAHGEDPVQRYLMTHDSASSTGHIKTQPISVIGHVDMGKARSLEEFVAWGKSFSPADHYAIYIWNHGTGFQTRNIAYDYTTLSSITVPELRQVLGNSGPWEVVGFDACIMGMAEIAYELKDVTPYIVASQNLVPTHGFDYAKVLVPLVANPNISGREVAINTASGFYDAFTAHPDSRAPGTISVIDTSKMGDVRNAALGLASALLDDRGSGAPVDDPVVQNSIRSASYQRFNHSQRFQFADLRDVAQVIEGKAINSDVSGAATLLRAASTRPIIYERHAAAFPRASGLSLWMPFQIGNFVENLTAYDELTFAKSTRWSDLLQKLFPPSLNWKVEGETGQHTWPNGNYNSAFVQGSSSTILGHSVWGLLYVVTELPADEDGTPVLALRLTLPLGGRFAVGQIFSANPVFSPMNWWEPDFSPQSGQVKIIDEKVNTDGTYSYTFTVDGYSITEGHLTGSGQFTVTYPSTP